MEALCADGRRGFASAIFLLGVSAMMTIGSVERIVVPQPIRYPQALLVAVVGLAVKVVCALIFGKAHQDDRNGGHSHGDDLGRHDDLNLKSAYVHVVADAATSVLAIIALVGGLLRGWSWLDPLMGIVGAALVAIWAKGLIFEAGRVLLDGECAVSRCERARTDALGESS